MSDDWNNDLNDPNDNSGGGLRKALEAALADAKEAKEQAAKYKNQLAVTTVATSLKEKGYKDTAAKWAAVAGVDVSDAKAFDKWLAEDGAEFKLPESEHDPNAEQQTEALTDPAAPEGAEQLASAVTNLRSVATSPSAVALVNALKAIPDDMDKKAVYAALAGAGV